MSGHRLSVIVVSIGRPEALRRCLIGLSQQAVAGCEVIVVADAEGQAAVRSLPVKGALKLLPQRQPNISAARNAGLSAAAGDIVAFIDDDAVAEPVWSHAILGAFDDPDIAAVTGPVLGRNGISLQWGPMAVNRLGQDIEIDPNAHFRDGFARKLQGTNMAVRRDVLEKIGGFDEALHFYLDDTDIAVRLANAGMRSAWVPKAVVHHGFFASARRTEDRVPLSLFDIGASTAVFLKKHAPKDEQADALHGLEAAQSSRLMRLVQARKLGPEQMRKLLVGLKDGIEDGRGRESLESPIGPNPNDFDPFQGSDPPKQRVLAGRFFQRERLRAQARDLVASGQPVSLFVFEPTPRKHKVLFTNDGWWEQTGGLFGPSDRNGPRLRMTSFQARITTEVRRIATERGIDAGWEKE